MYIRTILLVITFLLGLAGMLAILLRKIKQWRCYVPVVLTVCIGAGLSLGAFVVVSDREQTSLAQEFSRMAENRWSVLERQFDKCWLAMEALDSFYEGSQKVERDEFRAFVEPLLYRLDGIQAVEWIPRVPDAERTKYEEAARQDGLANFQITALTGDGNIAPAPQSKEYYPVYYVEPYKGNEVAVGFDMSSEPTRLQALKEARNSGKITATERIELVQDTEHQYSFLVFLPVYEKGTHPETVEARIESLEGFVLMVIRAVDFVKAALERLSPSGVDVYIRDISAPADKGIVCTYLSPRTSSDSFRQDSDSENNGQGAAGVQREMLLKVGGRDWLVRCVATPAFFDDAHRMWYSWVVLTGGLILTGLLAAYLLAGITRAGRREEAVEAKIAGLESEITEHEQIEKSLELSESSCRVIFGAVSDAVIVQDIDTGKVLDANRKACEMFGYTLEEIKGLAGEAFGEGFPACDTKSLSQICEKAVGSGEPAFYKCTAKDKEGNSFPIEVSHQYVIIEGQKRLLAVVRNVCEHKGADGKIKRTKKKVDLQAQEMEMLNRAKSEFLANVSHEVRIPMNAIIGFSQVLAEEELTDEQRNCVEVIRESAENLLLMVNDMLDFSRIEAGKLDTQISDCSLEQLFAVVESLMRPLAKEKGLVFEILQCGELPLQIRTDPVRLRQCLINLISNAVKFTEKGHIYVNVSVQKLKKEPHICFDVEDTGVGIPPEKQKTIFRVSAQTGGGTSHGFGGTGLGLVITRQLAELLGGELTLSSQAGKGSVFSLKIPTGVDMKSQPSFNKYDLVTELTAESDSQDVSEQPRFSGKVLVAEDSKTNQMLINLLLERMGLEVVMAEDGKEALQKALGEPFDLIFMDIQMPNMNGYDAARAMRKKGLRTPIIALTAYAMKGDQEKCITAGCDDYLPKPIDQKKLQETIGKYLSGRKGDLSEQIDSARAQVDELSQMCSDQVVTQPRPKQPAEADEGQDVIDWQAVTNICDDEDVIRKTVEMFLKDSPQCVESLNEAIRQKDSKLIRMYAHSLKGASLQIGAKHLSEKAYALEHAGRAEDVATAVSLIGDLQKEFEKLMSFLSRPDWIQIAKKQG